ncbi:hypothetical protein ACHAXS_006268 [Conticribra weissflogii]
MSCFPFDPKQTGVDKSAKGKIDLDLSDAENESGGGGSHMDECYICDDGGDLVCCDGCEKAYHEECLKVKADELPEVWHCPSCISEREKSANSQRKEQSRSDKASQTTTAGNDEDRISKQPRVSSIGAGSLGDNVASGNKNMNDRENKTIELVGGRLSGHDGKASEQPTEGQNNATSLAKSSVNDAFLNVRRADFFSESNCSSSNSPAKEKRLINESTAVESKADGESSSVINAPSDPKRARVDKVAKETAVIELIDTESEQGDSGSLIDKCYICNDGGDLICCDGCEKFYHEDCVKFHANDFPEALCCPSCVTKSKNTSTVHGTEKSGLKGSPNTSIARKMADSHLKEPLASLITAPDILGQRPIGINSIEVAAGKGTTDKITGSLIPLIQNSPQLSGVSNLTPFGTGANSKHDNPPVTNLSSGSSEKHKKYYRTVTVPDGVRNGETFHVLLDGETMVGVICPQGVVPGDTILLLEPGCTKPPISPRKIFKINARRLIAGINKKEAPIITRAFWKVLWPLLQADEWFYNRQENFDFGATTFFRSVCTSIKSSLRVYNQDYFDTISGVLNYVTSVPKYNDGVKMFHDEVKKGKDARKKERARKSSSEVYMNGPSFRKSKHSRIGSEYQVRSLPRSRDFNTGGSMDFIQDHYWDPDKASNDAFTFLHSLRHEDREKTFVTIHKANYDITSIPHPTKSTWEVLAEDESFSQEFHEKIMHCKKQMGALASCFDKLFPSSTKNEVIGFCNWYYYHKYKQSRNYYVLKALLKGGRINSDRNSDDCAICDDGGNLICCDSCEKSFHLECLNMQSSDVENIGNWSCPECVKMANESVEAMSSSNF